MVIEEIKEDQALIRALDQSKIVTGVVEVDFYLSSIKEQPTKYIDKDGNEQSTNEKDLNNIKEDIKEIIQIGFYENSNGVIQVAKMPRSVEKVPNKLPRQITSLSEIFKGATNFNQDISSWDVSSVTNMSDMFHSALKFNNGGKALNWDDKTKNVTNMKWMFKGAKKFNQDLSKWNVAKVKNWDSSSLGYEIAKYPKKLPPFKN